LSATGPVDQIFEPNGSFRRPRANDDQASTAAGTTRSLSLSMIRLLRIKELYQRDGNAIDMPKTPETSKMRVKSSK
jgi:hypothetical protein